MWLMSKKAAQHREQTHRSNVEIIANRLATKEVVEETKEVNEKLRDLLVNHNHITLKIFLSAGGKRGTK